MKAILTRVRNVLNDRVTRVLFYDQTLKKGYASLASFSKLFVLRRVIVTVVAYPLSLVCWVFLVVLNRFTPVRMYRFERPQRPEAASVYIEQLEPLCRELQDSGHKGFLIFIDASATTNLELLKLYASHFSLYLDDRVAFIRTIFALVPRFGFSNTFVNHSLYNSNWLLPPAIKHGKHKNKIPEAISKLNLEPFKFVILTHNSLSYVKKYNPDDHHELNRFTDIRKAEDAIKLVHDNGMKTVRMGVDTDELPDSLKRLPIIDLSGKLRTDAQDLWLAEHCLFLWCINNNGSWHFAHKYNRPTLITNSYALSRGFQANLFTLQMIWDEGNDKYLTLQEIANLRGVVGRISKMKDRCLAFVENSPSDLVSAVVEMLKYANNELEYTAHDISLLSQFSEVLVQGGYPPMLINHSQPCISFLSAHQELLI
ncbi:hypothetical protein EMGBS4_18490 [Acidimicrobiaceae bacterium]|nr:hypothetical protein EMGBS4_18490 [Acidimicrobiaceae bacterium]